MKLSRSHGKGIIDPSDSQINYSIDDIEDNNGSFVILDNSNDFVQAAGKLPNQLVVEYKIDGNHFQSIEQNLTADQVKEIFKKFRHGLIEYKKDYQWKKIELNKSENAGCTSIFLVFISLVGLLISCTATNQEGIFREINVWPKGEITLGEKFSQKDEIAIQFAPLMYELEEGSFRGAGSIIVFTDSLDQVQKIRFQYLIGYNFEKEVTDYKLTLGDPSKTIYTDSLDLVIWMDDKTTFELTREKMGNGIVNYSILKDNL